MKFWQIPLCSVPKFHFGTPLKVSYFWGKIKDAFSGIHCFTLRFFTVPPFPFPKFFRPPAEIQLRFDAVLIRKSVPVQRRFYYKKWRSLK
ncbi:MAG: hypothetical protein GY795_00520 [Desulfobacterales bacterium]|nr:hypothetical protein [Desulfobacterales bacterium]